MKVPLSKLENPASVNLGLTLAVSCLFKLVVNYSNT